jgi:hypothetical protein
MELLFHSVGVKQCELGPIKLGHFQFVALDSVDAQHWAVHDDVALQPFDFDFDFVYLVPHNFKKYMRFLGESQPLKVTFLIFFLGHVGRCMVFGVAVELFLVRTSSLRR